MASPRVLFGLAKYLPKAWEEGENTMPESRLVGIGLLKTRMKKYSRHYLFTKRMIDITMAIIVFLVLLPFLPIIAYKIKRQSPGPILFKQLRTGKDGVPFYMYKFRTMHVNAEADTKQAMREDPRKFPFGQFLRHTTLDEMPQLINVLKGEMSVVGPRPHMVKHTEYYAKLIPNFMERHAVKPGVTGLAQALGWRGDTHELWMMEERVRHDLYYIRHRSIKMDLAIIRRSLGQFIEPPESAQ